MSAAPERLDLRVERKTEEAEGIAGFRLVAADGGPLPGFEAGAHIEVDLPGGIVRHYSLCNAPAPLGAACYEIGVLRDPASRGGSLVMHDGVHEGGTLRASPPRNHFPLVDDASHSLLLAGGIGVTPLLSMAEALHARGADFALHYATRSPARTAYAERLRRSAFADRVHLHHDDGPPAQRLALDALLRAPASGRHLYACGPQGFLDAVRGTARAAGWDDAQVHFEYFGNAAVPEAGAGADVAFEVQLGRGGRIVPVAATQTVVDALAAAGVEIPVSCAQGVCGTCLTRVLEGEVDHRDLYLTPAEQAAHDQFLPCCSRARDARLVIEP